MRLLLSVTALFLTSCASGTIPQLDPARAGQPDSLTAAEFRRHVLMFDTRGKLLDPLSDTHVPHQLGPVGYRNLDAGSGAAQYLQAIIDGIEARKRAEGRVRLIFFFHGGLNSRVAALQRAAEHIVRIRKDRPDLYPIFVNWQTSLPGSYKDHLLWIRKGQDTYTTGLLFAPAVLVGDVVHSITEIPIADYMAAKEWHRYADYDRTERRAFVAAECRTDDLDFREGRMAPQSKSAVTVEAVEMAVMGVLTKWWSAGLLAAAGSSAWSSMLYTSDRLFYSDRELHHYGHGYDYQPTVTGSGWLSEFLRLLSNSLDKNDDIVLVGHSAGTVAINRLIENFGDKLPISTLVYMAPACTIDELMEGGRVTRFLRQDPARQRHLYILALHELAEINEKWYLDATPRGSLLVWLDEFIQPKHSEFAGMMMGRARNLRLHGHLIPCDLHPQITITAFNQDPNADPSVEPQRHSDFGELPYWKKEAWRPERPCLESVDFTRDTSEKPSVPEKPCTAMRTR